jgi:hypothetical protein
MAGTFTTTGSYSNLTRLELEQLRKADFYAGGKALTVGDAGNVSGGVGAGNLNAEPYFTGPSVLFDEIYSAIVPSRPGLVLGTSAGFTGAAETVRWYGPTAIVTSINASGRALAINTWNDPTTNFVTAGVQPGDILLVRDNAQTAPINRNRYAAATVQTVSTNTLTLTNINNPENTGNTTQMYTVGGHFFPYVVVRPAVAQLFAVPGSGPLGREQTFLMVDPAAAPTVDQINAARVRDLAIPSYAADSSVDRADAVFGPAPSGPNFSNSPRSSSDKLGYRVILYRGLSDGTGPDLTAPITSLNPVIDAGVPAADQRMTIDYRAGVVRFSCAPAAGGDIKPSGGNGAISSQGRLNLYAVFFAVNKSVTAGTARGLYSSRSTEQVALPPATVKFDPTKKIWQIGSTTNVDANFVVEALGSPDSFSSKTKFGVYDSASTTTKFRGLVIDRSTNQLKAIRHPAPNSTDPDQEFLVGDKTEYTVGDASRPALNPAADYNPAAATWTGLRDTTPTIVSALNAAAIEGYGTVHLRRGRFTVSSTVYVPPGVTIRGEGAATIVSRSYTSSSPGDNQILKGSLFKVGPNLSWGVYDFDADVGNNTSFPTNFTLTSFSEGLDLVWNPVRRVWGCVWEDNGEILFNELRLDGTYMYNPGLVLNSGENPLFTASSSNSTYHTTGHYPRLAYQKYADEYAVVWVAETNSGLGPEIRLQVVEYNPLPEGGYHAPKWGSSMTVNPDDIFYPYSDHPSVAVDNSSTGDYYICVVGWAYTTGVAISRTFLHVISANTQSTVNFDIDSFATPNPYMIVSSNDVSSNDDGGFVRVWSVRAHPMYTGSTGTLTTTIGTEGLFTDASFESGHFGTNKSIQVGSRFLVFNTTATLTDTSRNVQKSGITAFVRSIEASTGVRVQVDGIGYSGPYAPKHSVAGGVQWAIAPVCRLWAVSWDHVSGASSPAQVAGPPQNPDANTYHLAEREPDFVRIHRAEGTHRYLVAYQNFDTNSGVNRFNSYDFNEEDPVLPLASTTPHREHLSTSFILIESNFNSWYTPYPEVQVVGPSKTSYTNGLESEKFSIVGNANALYHMARDWQVVARSLGGGRHLSIPFANFARNFLRPEWDISYRNAAQRIVNGRYPSMIPDVTWSGSDWVVVSPPPCPVIESDTGVLTDDGFGNVLLTDASFYFGSDASNGLGDSVFHHTTVGTSDFIYFPSTGETIPITAHQSAHSVKIANLPTGILSGTTNVSWVLVLSDPQIGGKNLGPGNDFTGKMKNPGYRVSLDGKVVVTSGGLTNADELASSESVPNTGVGKPIHPVELLKRSDTYFGNINYGTPAGNTRVHTTGFAYNQHNDLLPSIRLPADVTFKGVAVGGPKGSNETLLGKPPAVAIAWGDNFYGFLEHHVSGSTDSLNIKNLNFYRQTFGPWRSKIENLRLEGGGNKGGAGGFRLASKTLAFTRHGPPITANPFFATDGYRNIFAHWAVGGVYTYGNSGTATSSNFRDPRDGRHYFPYVNRLMTDAEGRNPIRQRIAAAYDVPRTLSAAATGVDNAPFQRNTSVAKSVWTGSDFITVISHNTYLEVIVTPGDDMDRASLQQADELTGDSYWNTSRRFNLNLANLIATATVGGGDGGPPLGYSNGVDNVNKTVQFPVDVVDFNICWNGDRLAIAWTSGHNYEYGADEALGGALLGITMVYPGHFDYRAPGYGIPGYSNGYPKPVEPFFYNIPGRTPLGSVTQQNVNYNVSTFLLDHEVWVGSDLTGNNKGRIRDAHIFWDGKNFVIPYARQYMGETWHMRIAHVPPEGPGQKIHIKRHAGPIGTISAANDGQGMLQFKMGDGRIHSFTGDFYSNALAVQPGDTIWISRGSASGTALSGFYPVNGIDHKSGRVWLGFDLVASGGLSGETLYGSVFSGMTNNEWFVRPDQGGDGISDIEPIDKNYHYRVNTGPNLFPSRMFNDTHGISDSVAKVWAAYYLPDRDTYVIFTSRDTTYGVFVQEVSRSSHRVREVILASSTRHVSVGFNGSDFMVIHWNPTSWTSVPSVVMVTKDLQVSSYQSFPYNPEDFYGNSQDKAPGLGYAAYNSSLTPRAFFKGFHIDWNAKLQRWVVAASVMVYEEELAFDYNTHSYVAGPLDNGDENPREQSGATAYSNRIATLSSTAARVYRQPGLRFVLTSHVSIGAVNGNSSGIASVIGTMTNFNNWQPSTSNNTFSFSNKAVFDTNFYSGGTAINQYYGSSIVSSQAGDCFVFKNHTLNRTIIRRLWANGHIDIGTYYHAFAEGALSSYPANGHAGRGHIYRPTTYAMVNSFGSADFFSGYTIKTDTHASDITAGSPASAQTVWGAFSREDVWVITFAFDGAPIEIENADDVRIEDVEISGSYVDITEKMTNFARPYYKRGGMTFGHTLDTTTTYSSSSATTVVRPHVYPVYPTPAGVVENVKLINVRSKTPVKFDMKPDSTQILNAPIDRRQLINRRG